MVRKISDWKVIKDAEILSDHRYIRITIQADRQPGTLDRSLRSLCLELVKRQKKPSTTRWATRKLDRDLLVAATRTAWSSPPRSSLNLHWVQPKKQNGSK